MMTAVLVDSNVLLDLMTEDTRWLSWSAEAVEKAADRFRLVINPIIYAEVSIRYSRIEDLEAALPKAMLDREAIPYEAAFLAGKCFLAYRQRGEQSNRRFRTFLSAPTRRLPGIGC
jgi:predicted nucleic acid-binding protein